MTYRDVLEAVRALGRMAAPGEKEGSAPAPTGVANRPQLPETPAPALCRHGWTECPKCEPPF